MKGYNKADFGNLQVWMTHHSKWDRYYMKGCCNKDNVTQSHVEVINVAQSHNQQNLETGEQCFAVKPFSKGALRLRAGAFCFRGFLVQTIPNKQPELLINLSSQGPHLMGATLSTLLRAVHPGTIAMADFRQRLVPFSLEYVLCFNFYLLCFGSLCR